MAHRASLARSLLQTARDGANHRCCLGIPPAHHRAAVSRALPSEDLLIPHPGTHRMPRFDFSLSSLSLTTLVLALASLPACGSAPAHTETTRTTSVSRPESGGEVRRDATETTEVERDGSSTSERTETTTSSTPPE
jgi:hypothetical protein